MDINYQLLDGCGIISINSNILSCEPRSKIIKHLKEAQLDKSVKRVLIIGNKEQYSSAHTLSYYASKDAYKNLTVAELAKAIEEIDKPVIAAIYSHAISAELEISLSCHYRIANKNAKFGFPEVKYGLIPTGGGTQRLPRLIGIKNAFSLLQSGKIVPTAVALKYNLIDDVSYDVLNYNDFIQYAIDFATTINENDVKTRRNKLETIMSTDDFDFIKKSDDLISKSIFDAVLNTTKMSIYEGNKVEERIFDLLYRSPHFKSILYVVKAQDNLKKWNIRNSEINHSVTPNDIKLGGVVGLGTMGRGIAISFLSAGIPIIVLEQNPMALKNGIKYMHNMLQETLDRSIITQRQADRMKSMITGTSDYSDFKNCDFVIEAVFEDIEVKKEVFYKLDKFCKPGAILASNTSALNIDEIAGFTKRPNKVMGTHFFAPAHIMKLLENVYGSKSDAKTIATGMHLGNRMKKVTVLVGNCMGFVGNRMYLNYMMECDFMLEEGLFPREVDAALENYGLTFGRYRVADLSGCDILYLVHKNLGFIKNDESFVPPIRYSNFTNLLYKHRRYGQKVGAGWYDYTKEKPTEPLNSNFMHNLIRDERHKKGLIARSIPPEEVVERALYPLINEGFKILEDGIASSPFDIDLVWLYGYSWPKHTGGPMHYAFTVGLKKILKRIEYYHKTFGSKSPHWIPSEMLVYLASLNEIPALDCWVDVWHQRRSKL